MWVIGILLILTGLLILLLCMPFDVHLRFDSQASRPVSIRLSWFLGLVHAEPGRGAQKPQKKKKKKRARKKRKKPISRYVKLATKAFIKRAVRLPWDVLRCLHITSMDINLRVGLGDAYDTGLLFAAVGPVALLIPDEYTEKYYVEPDFSTEPVLAGHTYADIRLWPIQLVGIAFSFFFSKPVLHTIKQFVALRWRAKK